MVKLKKYGYRSEHFSNSGGKLGTKTYSGGRFI